MKARIRMGGLLGLVARLAVVAVATAPTIASAQVQTFWNMPGIPGGSTVAAYQGWIDVLSLRQTYPGTTQNPCEIQIVKGLDVAGPLLWAAAVTGEIFTDQSQIVIATMGGEAPVELYEIDLEKNLRIISIADTEGGGVPFLETVTLRADQAKLTYYPTPGEPESKSFSCK